MSKIPFKYLKQHDAICFEQAEGDRRNKEQHADAKQMCTRLEFTVVTLELINGGF
jgi:hypothetical protein